VLRGERIVLLRARVCVLEPTDGSGRLGTGGKEGGQGAATNDYQPVAGRVLLDRALERGHTASLSGQPAVAACRHCTSDPALLQSLCSSCGAKERSPLHQSDKPVFS
jgi:hypothetical protein